MTSQIHWPWNLNTPLERLNNQYFTDVKCNLCLNLLQVNQLCGLTRARLCCVHTVWFCLHWRQTELVALLVPGYCIRAAGVDATIPWIHVDHLVKPTQLCHPDAFHQRICPCVWMSLLLFHHESVYLCWFSSNWAPLRHRRTLIDC